MQEGKLLKKSTLLIGKSVFLMTCILFGAFLINPVAASAQTVSSNANFYFNYDGSYGTAGLSQPYSSPTTTGQSYGTGVAIQASDPSQKVYSLVEANANVGVGGCRGCFPASSRTISPSSTAPSYLGPYSIVRRTSNGAIDTSFGDSGYISAFPASDNANYKFTSLCIAPGSGNIVIVGQETTSSGAVGVVERLRPPARGSGTTRLDTSFNSRSATPGIVTIATPGGNNSPTLYGCAVSGNGTIYVGGVDDAASSSLLVAAKIKSNGNLDSSFGGGGIAELPVESVNGSGASAEVTNVSVNGAESNFPDMILSGFSLTRGAKQGSSSTATAMVVAVNDRTGALDTNFNGTGELINANYGEAVLGHISSRGRTATDLYVVYGTPRTDAAAFVGYPITGAVPDTSKPTTSQTGTFTVPSGFASAQGYTVNSRGQILVSGDTSSNAETLTAIGGSRVLG
jgi:hypothetical protein